MIEFKLLGIGVLSWMVFLPVLGMIVLLLMPKSAEKYLKYITVGFTSVLVLLAIVMMTIYDPSKAGINSLAGFQFVEKLNWIDIPAYLWDGRIKIEYFLGVDGISFPMVLLTALISFIGAIASFSVKRNEKGYYTMYLFLVSGMMGVFVALDFFLFFVFWEIMLLPMYFLIGIWGGERREYAAIKFFLYTFFGSAFILVVMIGLYFSSKDPETGLHTFNMLTLMDPRTLPADSLFGMLNETWRLLAFVSLFIGFAIKVPAFPFHTWLPDAHVEAPTAISVILAGVLLKMGTYGMLRISWSIFPDGAKYFMVPIAIIAAINIIYGALCAMAQKDFKKLIAYSSISHMGYVMLGMASLTAIGISGAVFQMFNHGTITAVLFLSVGVIYDRAHTRGLNDFGGLANKMPKYFAVLIVAFFASIGLPGLSAFISETFIFIGGFTNHFIRVVAIISMLGIILNAAYILWTIQRLFFGTLPEKWNGLTDISARELISTVPLLVIVVVLGIFPSYMLDLMKSSVNLLVNFIWGIN
ncbi:MAG TPA: NADH-quinone oxidoreductase subunit M [Ignavibacteria bacterium]|nr:NADH-quinone oxidoreductase subunit M [Ignavibacteria bacterium]